MGLSSSLGLSAFYALFFVVGYLVVFAVADFLIRDAVADNEREIIRERMIQYRDWFNNGNFEELRTRFSEQSLRSEDLFFVRISGPQTNAMLFSSPRGQELLDSRALGELARSGRSVVATIISEEPRNIWTVASTPAARRHLIQAGRISTRAFEPVNRFRRFFLWASIPVVLLAMIGGAFLRYQAMKPVRDLTATAGEIIETGKLDRRVAVENRRGDLAGMGILFNEMLDRNQDLIRSMKESLDNTAHDLRTPMARMRASAERALELAGDVEAKNEALADCLEESDRILTMLNTLMDIAEAETGVMNLQRERVDLVALIEQVADLYELVAGEEEISVKTNLPDTLVIEADRSRLQQAIANLVDNAIKYGREGGTVEIQAAQSDGGVLVKVIDDGIGIGADDLPRIWERLFRADQSRSKRGLGLGLSFVKAIVTAHGGEISVESEPGEGTTFTVTLPPLRE